MQMDTNFQLCLGVANMIVALLNVMAYSKTGDMRDMVSAIAWFGSMLYWLWRASL